MFTTTLASSQTLINFMWNRQTVTGDPTQVLIDDQVIGVGVGVTAEIPVAVHRPDEQLCHRGPSIFTLSSSTSLRSVFDSH